MHLISRFANFLRTFVGNKNHITRQQNVRVFTFLFQFGVARMIPNRVRKKTILNRNAENAVALLNLIIYPHISNSQIIC